MPLFQKLKFRKTCYLKTDFGMKTSKLILDMAKTNQNREGEKSYIPVTFYKSQGNIGGKVLPENQDNTRLQELSK